MLSQKLKEELAKRLKEEKAKLEEELDRFAKKDYRPIGDYDTIFPQFDQERTTPDESADEVEEYDKLLGIEHALETRLKEVNDAIDRLHTKNFGLCQNCGRQISKERLLANPAATTCLRCKRKS